MRMWKYGLAGMMVATMISSGCASKQGASRSTNMQTQVALLDTRLNALEQRQDLIEGKAWNQREDVSYLKGKVEGSGRAGGASLAYAAPAATIDGERSKLSIREIQQALKNAGFDPGSVDGKLGRRTRGAIREFQRAHGLKADGIVGPQTRTMLISYLTGNQQAGVPKY